MMVLKPVLVVALALIVLSNGDPSVTNTKDDLNGTNIDYQGQMEPLFVRSEARSPGEDKKDWIFAHYRRIRSKLLCGEYHL